MRRPYLILGSLDLSGEYPYMILVRLYIDELASVCEDIPYLSLLVVTASGGVSISSFFS